jgi:hypothetical protein
MALALAAVRLGFGAVVKRLEWVVAGFAFALLLLRARDTFVAQCTKSPGGRGLT